MCERARMYVCVHSCGRACERVLRVCARMPARVRGYTHISHCQVHALVNKPFEKILRDALNGDFSRANRLLFSTAGEWFKDDASVVAFIGAFWTLPVERQLDCALQLQKARFAEISARSSVGRSVFSAHGRTLYLLGLEGLFLWFVYVSFDVYLSVHPESVLSAGCFWDASTSSSSRAPLINSSLCSVRRGLTSVSKALLESLAPLRASWSFWSPSWCSV